jgi:phage protein U
MFSIVSGFDASIPSTKSSISIGTVCRPKMPNEFDCVTIRICSLTDLFRRPYSLHSYFRAGLACGLLSTAFVCSLAAQDKKSSDGGKPQPTPANKLINNKNNNQPPTADTVAESAILIYGGLGGRKTLDQIRKTAIERGKMSLVNAQGLTESVNYQKWVIRGDNLHKEKIRIDQEFPNIRYSLVFANDKTFGIYNDAVFSPRGDAAKEFENRIFHGLEALLRYKENESALELGGHEKIMGVDYYFLDVTDKAGRKTRFYISSKTYRVMMIDYQEDGIKYRRKFYDYNYAQGTLVPFRSTLTANDKLVEESEVLTVTFGQRVDEDLFKSGS